MYEPQFQIKVVALLAVSGCCLHTIPKEAADDCRLHVIEKIKNADAVFGTFGKGYKKGTEHLDGEASGFRDHRVSNAIKRTIDSECKYPGTITQLFACETTNNGGRGGTELPERRTHTD